MHSQLLNGSSTVVTAAILQLPQEHNTTTNASFIPSYSSEHLAGLLTFTTLWRSIFLLLLLGNLKNLPFMWTLRIVNAFRFCLRSQRSKVAPSPDQIFQPLITTSQCPLMEIDFNLHKTNSSYFSDVDIARTHLLCTLFSPGIEVMRGGTAAITGSKAPLFGIALGAVSCSFKKELKPYETYELWTRILSWDSKWIFILTHFVRKDSVKPRRFSLYPEQNNNCAVDGNGKIPQDNIVASALSRCVFKQGRKTVSPEFMLKASGLLPEDTLPDKSELTRCSAAMEGEEAQAHFNLLLDEKVTMTTSEEIELERRRGMEIANSLAVQNQQALEKEFSGDEEALGKHTDGTGITGVVSTLCQLAHLKKGQIL